MTLTLGAGRFSLHFWVNSTLHIVINEIVSVEMGPIRTGDGSVLKVTEDGSASHFFSAPINLLLAILAESRRLSFFIEVHHPLVVIIE